MTETTDFDTVLQRELSAHFVRAVSGIFECMGRALICLDQHV